MRSAPARETASTASPSIPTASWSGRRLRSHLEALKERFAELLGECEIQESAGTDYAFRLFVQKSAWMQVLAGLAEETDYDNFKSEVAHHQGEAGAAYEHSLHEVWSVMHKLQESEGLPPSPPGRSTPSCPSSTGSRRRVLGWDMEDRIRGQFPLFDSKESVMQFSSSTLRQRLGAPTAFDWTEWQESAEEFVEDRRKSKSRRHHDPEIVHDPFRADRFCEGHLAAMFENGHVVALLRRLKAIRDDSHSGILRRDTNGN